MNPACTSHPPSPAVPVGTAARVGAARGTGTYGGWGVQHTEADSGSAPSCGWRAVTPTTAAMLRRWKCTDTNHNSSGSGQTPHTPIYCHNYKAQKNRSALSKTRRFRTFGIFGVSLNITVDLGVGGGGGGAHVCVVPTHDTIFRFHNHPFGSVRRNGDQQGKKQSKHQVGSRNACESFRQAPV